MVTGTQEKPSTRTWVPTWDDIDAAKGKPFDSVAKAEALRAASDRLVECATEVRQLAFDAAVYFDATAFDAAMPISTQGAGDLRSRAGWIAGGLFDDNDLATDISYVREQAHEYADLLAFFLERGPGVVHAEDDEVPA